MSWSNSGGAPATAAHVAVAARHAGYPDMDSVLMRVMAARPGPDDHGFHDPATDVRMAATAAVPLALVDPGVARVLLEQLEARGGLDSAGIGDVAGHDWLRAWALVDLEKAEALVDAQLAALEKGRGASCATARSCGCSTPWSPRPIAARPPSSTSRGRRGGRCSTIEHARG